MQQKLPSLHPTSQRTIHIKGSSQQTAPSHYLILHQVWPEQKGSLQDISTSSASFCTSLLPHPGRALRLPCEGGVRLVQHHPFEFVLVHPSLQWHSIYFNNANYIIFKKFDHKTFIDGILDRFSFIFHMLNHIILDDFYQHLSYIQVIHYTCIQVGNHIQETDLDWAFTCEELILPHCHPLPISDLSPQTHTNIIQNYFVYSIHPEHHLHPAHLGFQAHACVSCH